MGNGVYVAMAGAQAQTDRLDVVSNNVANAATTGYRAERVAFGQVLAGAASQDMNYAGIAGRSVDTSQGVIRQTDNPLDLALVGDGYFSVQTPRGVRYTRAGDFRLSDTGTIVNSSGYPVMDATGGTIEVPDGTRSLSVSADGVVRADEVEIGQLQLVTFDAEAMTREGSNLFAASRSPVASDSTPEVLSGAIEGSNVNVVRGMVGMVRVSRTYEALLNMIENYRQIDSRTARDLGGPK